MNPAQLLEHFNRISEAPDAVARLRRFILDLAVRGKLVAQDPNDEPAAELLKRIQAEKSQLVKEGRLKKTMADLKIESLDVPFDLPPVWVWTCLGDVAQYGISDKVDSNKDIAVDTWVLDLEDIEKGTSRLIERIYSLARPFRSTKTIFKSGDVLFGKLRPYLNKVLVADQDGVCTTEIIPIRGYCGMAPEYMKLVLKSSLTMARVDRLMYGMKMPRLGTGDAVALSFPLPPLAEQHRIVAKVDELMALCDQLEAAQSKREKQRDRLVAASLHCVGTALPESLPAVAHFHLDNLPHLTTCPEHIKQLRQTILNLAVRGRLVPQDPNDEPAAELLKRIQVEKARLVKEEKIKKDRPLPQILEEEKLFVLPKGWEWVRMQAVYDVRDGTHDTPKYVEGDGVPLITSRNFVDGKIAFDDAKLISWGDHNSIKKRSCVDRGDILYSMIGGNIGNQVLVCTDREFSIKNVALFKYYTKKESLPEYLNLFLKTVTIGLQNKAVGGAQPFVSLSLLRNILFPFPPLAEQHRIVAKVDELVALCDQLEAQLATTQTDSRRLLEAVLRDALVFHCKNNR
jgi:type I restriction enzyme S subunit